MQRLGARYNASDQFGRPAPIRQIGWFAVIGIASTVGQGLLYRVLRHGSPPGRPTSSPFSSSPSSTPKRTDGRPSVAPRARAVRAQPTAGVLFVLACLVTTGAVLPLRPYRPSAFPATQALVPVPGFVLVTALRFALLRPVVFGRRRDSR
ncbi:hypothetical protein ACIRBZ_11670 [Streptomyces sp. NPDC094038]|uniref:hypothetical protein n=1 Tax=Streptomyces sp. NPDC094038 TaxID=3366055 RepID=UPI0038281234